MANELLVKQGTPIIWRDGAAAGADYDITLCGLADGAARMGQAGDLGAAFAGRYLMVVELTFAAAPTAGLTVPIFWVPSHNNTQFPGGVSGSDGVWSADGEEDEWAKQLGAPVGILNCTNDADVIQRQSFVMAPVARYGVPVVDNNSGQALAVCMGDSSSSSGEDDYRHRITLVPLIDEVQ